MSHLVLIVDDDISTQALLQEMLKLEGYTPIVCSDGKIALEMLMAIEFRLVILDITLPEVNGWDVFKFIKENIHRTCVLITTGTEDERTEEFKNHDHEYFKLHYKHLSKEFKKTVRELVESSLKKRKPLNNIDGIKMD